MPYPKRYTNGKQAYEKMFDIICPREMQIKTVRSFYTPARIAKIQNTNTPKCWKGHGATGSLLHCWWKCTMIEPHTLSWHLGTFYKVKRIVTVQSFSLVFSKGVENMSTQKSTHYVYSSFIHNFNNCESNQDILQ